MVYVFKIDFSVLGPFGDFASGTTVPLLTFVSFLAVVATLRMQKDQLEMQKKEIQNSIVEMQETRKEMQEQSKTLSIQRFESTFFNMVNLHNEIVKTLSEKNHFAEETGELYFVGRQIFPSAFNEFRYIHNELLTSGNLTGATEIERIQQVYHQFFENRESQLGHYFRNLYRILKFIDEAPLMDGEKRTYVGIIKAQLSSYELALLLYNGLSNQGNKFLPLMQKYNLLDNLNQSLLIMCDTHYQIYKTYGKEDEMAEVTS